MRISTAALLLLAALPAACGSPATSPSSVVDDSVAGRPTTAAAEPATGGGAMGTATVVIGESTLEFTVDSCTIAGDALNVEATGEAGTLTIRHASPPTRRPPEPSFAVFVIEGDTRYEAPPAAVRLDVYDPAAGVATGEALDVVVGNDPAVTHPAAFTIECGADV